MAMDNRVTSIAILVFCSALACCNAGGVAAPQNIGQIFNVLNYGAKPGKNFDCTQAFILTWKAACNFVGPRARFFVPQGIFTVGEAVFQGPCKSQFPIYFQVAGTVQAMPDPSVYSGQGWMSFSHINGLIITGGGTIDGQGPLVWQYNDCKRNGNCVHLPASMHFNDVQHVKIKGLTYLNAMGFHMHITNSFMVSAHSLTITAPEDSPNTDGMHVSKSNSVKIARSTIRTGDDCVSLGQGATNVTVNKVICGPGHGISVGSLGKYPKEADVRGLIVKNCTLQGTDNGIRIKTYPASDPSAAAGMFFNDIVMENVKNPIIINQFYGSSSPKPSQVRISDIVYNNIRGTSATAVAISLKCSPAFTCTNLHFSNINLRPSPTAKGVFTSNCSNAHVMANGPHFPAPCK
ncbi:OLC1v1020579C1 [Oldenlandia corymbosa var. corymbosa]|uniref:OLC1v1020579C1 n=1 Tax=Oldenlandia corymbosa var. corymbosa TaxID=529605 RepID=A0AAV1EH24_OLDCO|nr:OLC1v1020579C1 [Oldenlandia corymbosa var. corymbosa]